MGCSKNLVDSEHLIFRFGEIGFRAYSNPEKLHGGIAVVNTCGFIEAAKEESINMILELCQAKDEGRLAHVYVMGCLSQRYRDQLEREIPQVDKFFGKFDWGKLVDFIAEEYGRRSSSPSARKCNDAASGRELTTPRHYAYIKISEGCDRRCAYCAIPLITGPQVSRTIDDILGEVKSLAAAGTREFQVIAQDTTSYGTDIYHRHAFPELVERMADIPGVDWIRVHYAYPNDFPEDLLRVMRERSNVCKYLDIALQHISDGVLQRMRRNISGDATRALIAEIRRQVPGIVLRTTLMVGFPGESEEDFEELLSFVREARFERMGAFAYSEEDGTYAAQHFKDDVSPEEKQRRLDELMNLQQKISAEICQERVGKQMRVIIDRKEGDYFVGRSEYDSPEVDGEVLLKDDGGPVPLIGDFMDVRITSADEYDLYAERL